MGPSSFSAFSLDFQLFLRENSHLFQHSDFIKLGILKACFVFESELFGACRQREPKSGGESGEQPWPPPPPGLPWHLTLPSATCLGRPPHHTAPSERWCSPQPYTLPTLRLAGAGPGPDWTFLLGFPHPGPMPGRVFLSIDTPRFRPSSSRPPMASHSLLRPLSPSCHLYGFWPVHQSQP